MDPVDILRRFNRTHTQRVGALDESFLGSGRALGPSRLLFEIGPDGAAVVELRRRLGLDSGYVSRLLRGLEADGLVVVGPDRSDGRRRRAALTTAGLAEWQRLDDRSDDLAARLVAPLTDRQRTRLATALAEADLLLRAATVTFETVDPGAPEAVAAVGAYVGELGRRFPDGFDPGPIGADDPSSAMAPPTGAFLVARSGPDVVACGGLQAIDSSTAEIKRMWVDREWRGVGLGRRQLAVLEGTAADLGYRRVVLDTNSALTEAIALYESVGYHPTERYNENPYAERWFEKVLPDH